MTLFYGFAVLALVALIIGFRAIWQLGRDMARPNLSFFSFLATFIGFVGALSGILLFRWSLPVIFTIGGLTVYAGLLWLWSLTAPQPGGPTS